MSPSTADPARTYAVLVGIERYEGGWTLNGPMHDVLAVHGWLTSVGVAADHIQTLVSPTVENEALLRQSPVDATPATSQNIHRALSSLHGLDGDLLVLFWTGHGFITDKRHRLVVADATDDDKVNFDLDALRASLASSYFPGLRRQILIVDTCATYERFAFTTPSVELPQGDPLPSEQFIFFAAQPGQAARNSGEEKRGLFSSELLRQLRDQPQGAWPPDMQQLAERVRREFDARRADGNLLQTPIYEWNQDWNGGAIKRRTWPQEPARTPRAPAGKLTFPQLAALTQALIACDKMQAPDGRTMILEQVRTEISSVVPRHADARSDVMAIIRTASNYSGGLEELLSVVQYLEGGSLAWRDVEQVVTEKFPDVHLAGAGA